MKLKFIDKTSEDYMYLAYELEMDGKNVFDVHYSADSPEDNTLYRNFNDVYKLGDLLKLAYEAGKRGETLEIENETIEGE